MKDAPLRECLILLAGLSLLAVPLAIVTAGPVLPARAVNSNAGLAVHSAPADVMVKSAHPFEWVELRRGETVLGRIEGAETEGEFECDLALHGERLIVAAQYGPDVPETALQLTLWLEAMPETVLSFWVDGDLLEEVEVGFHE